jgi:hypothetical protein
MVLIQLLLPITDRHNSTGARSPLNETAREIRDAFGGLTAYTRSPAKGVWTSPEGETEEDEVVMIEVVTGSFDRSWWRHYTATLAKRFGQEAIHVRALSIELLDPEAS